MIKDILKEQIQLCVSNLKPPSRKGWQTKNCHLCAHRGHSADTKSRLGIKFDSSGSIAIHCFNCKFDSSWKPNTAFTSSFKWFLITSGLSEYTVTKLSFEAFRDSKSFEAEHVKYVKPPITSKWQEIEFLKDTYSLEYYLLRDYKDSNFLSVANYACSRALYSVNELFWTPKRPTKLIVPFYYENKLVGYTERECNENSKSPKYINNFPLEYIYNLDLQRQRKHVIFCEGVLDAHLTSGISTLSNNVSVDQANYINNLGKEIIVCPDRDESGYPLVECALKNNWKVSFPLWDPQIKDAAQAVLKYGRLLTVKSIIESSISDALTIQLKWRFLLNERHKIV